MKKSFFCLFLISLLLGGCKTIKPAHVIITAGQSNTDGRVPNQQLPDYIKAMATDSTFNEGAYRYCKISQNRVDGKFIPFWPRTSRSSSPNAWTYDAVTYYLLEQEFQEDFYVIKWAIGGTSIAPPSKPSPNGNYWCADPKWLSENAATSKINDETGERGKSLLLSLTDEIDACIDQTLSKLKKGYKIDAFLWHQGESDQKRGKNYYENLKAVVTYIRSHLSEKTGKNYSNLPFILGTIPTNSRQYSIDVETGMKRLAEGDPYVYLIDMSVRELQRDSIHFNHNDAKFLGEEMYNCLINVLNRNK